MNWVKEFPTEPGEYWFYGQRYSGAKNELIFVNVRQGGGRSILYVAGGTFLFKGEVGENWAFAKVVLPELPKFD